MAKRAEAVQSTRRRILDAAMAVHDEQGIVAGRWPDIAERAGVSLATVYRHFATLEDLVTACGDLTMELVDPPSAESAAAAFRGVHSRRERIERLVSEAFAFYERAGRIVDNVRRDREKLAVLQRAHDGFEQGLQALTEEALRPLGDAPEEVRLARAMIDVRVWEALRERGLSADEAAQAASRSLLAVLPRGRPRTSG